MADDVVAVGDLLRISVALVDQMKCEADPTLVRVARIDRKLDGTVELWLENAPPSAGGR